MLAYKRLIVPFELRYRFDEKVPPRQRHFFAISVFFSFFRIFEKKSKRNMCKKKYESTNTSCVDCSKARVCVCILIHKSSLGTCTKFMMFRLREEKLNSFIAEEGEKILKKILFCLGDARIMYALMLQFFKYSLKSKKKTRDKGKEKISAFPFHSVQGF